MERLPLYQIAFRRMDIPLGEYAVKFELPAFIASNDAATAKMLTAPSTTPSISDGGAHYRFLSAGNWPTAILSEWVREKQVMSLEQAHYKISAYPAWFADLKDRGMLRVGKGADSIVYDLDQLGDESPPEFGLLDSSGQRL